MSTIKIGYGAAKPRMAGGAFGALQQYNGIEQPDAPRRGGRGGGYGPGADAETDANGNAIIGRGMAHRRQYEADELEARSHTWQPAFQNSLMDPRAEGLKQAIYERHGSTDGMRGPTGVSYSGSTAGPGQAGLDPYFPQQMSTAGPGQLGLQGLRRGYR